MFYVEHDSPLLSEDKEQRFHHIVSKLLYKSKRSRVDVKLAILFLHTRVLCTTKDSWRKQSKNTSQLPAGHYKNNNQNITPLFKFLAIRECENDDQNLSLLYKFLAVVKLNVHTVLENPCQLQYIIITPTSTIVSSNCSASICYFF